MRILIADDDEISCLALGETLRQRGFEVVEAHDGCQAWQTLESNTPPPLAILDWMMPELDGVEICRRARQRPELQGLYLILLTARGSQEHLIAGLQAGADDYVRKPFDPEELDARIGVGVKCVRLQEELATRIHELEDALARIRQLQGLLPICAFCKKIRDDRQYWHQLEHYLSQHAPIQFTHGVCPECLCTQLAELGAQV